MLRQNVFQDCSSNVFMLHKKPQQRDSLHVQTVHAIHYGEPDHLGPVSVYMSAISFLLCFLSVDVPVNSKKGIILHLYLLYSIPVFPSTATKKSDANRLTPDFLFCFRWAARRSEADDILTMHNGRFSEFK